MITPHEPDVKEKFKGDRGLSPVSLFFIYISHCIS